ncbi:MAG: hypothetical protein EON96_02690 [Caulobacteraceae bacterium]|nr:MAG: hypothetical protein EON96_02690 [Caulobacteraceae bacterium]
MKPAQIFAIARTLPVIRFALMLGGGGVATSGVAMILLWLQWLGGFPATDAVWLARIQGVVAIGLGLTVMMGLVMVMLAFGRVGKLSIRGPGGMSADLDFDNRQPPASGEGDAS